MKPVTEMTDAELAAAKAELDSRFRTLHGELKMVEAMLVDAEREQKARKLEAYWQAHPELERIEMGYYKDIDIINMVVNEDEKLVITEYRGRGVHLVSYEEALERIKRGSK